MTSEQNHKVIEEFWNALNALIQMEQIDQNSNLQMEFRALDSIKNQMEWEFLTDDEKQNKRLKFIKLSERYPNHEDSIKYLAYDNAVVELYNTIRSGLSAVDEQLKQQSNSNELILLTRTKALLFTEKMFIDEHRDLRKLRHFDYHVMKGFFNEVRSERFFNAIGLSLVEDQFDKMYKAWPERPWKEIQ